MTRSQIILNREASNWASPNFGKLTNNYMLYILIFLSITAVGYIIYRVFRSEESEPVPTPELKTPSSIRKAVYDSKRSSYSTPKRSHSKTYNNGYSNSNQSDDSLTFMSGYAMGSINDDSPSNNHSFNHHDHGGGGDFSGGGSSDSWGSSDSGSSYDSGSSDSGSSSSD